jgi:hypothetical protein
LYYRPPTFNAPTNNETMTSTVNAAGSGNAQVSRMSLFDQWANGDLVRDEDEGARVRVICGRSDQTGRVSSKAAKKVFFLDADDLATLQCASYYGGFGCGPPMKMYIIKDVVSKSLRKFGRSEIEKKLAARQKREEKKRIKEEEAEMARKRMKTNTTANIMIAASGVASAPSSAFATTAPSTTGDAKEISLLRGNLLRMAKRGMGFERSGAPKSWRIEVPGTSAATFAALMDQAKDVELATFVKSGAYYTVRDHDSAKFFGVKDDDELIKSFPREGVDQQIGDTVVVRYKPSAMELSVSGYAEWPSNW